MRLIDADDLQVDCIKTLAEPNAPRDLYVSKKQIDLAPTIDPVKHGKWERHNGWDRCSVCGAGVRILTVYGMKLNNYCPNCGARMDLEE